LGCGFGIDLSCGGWTEGLSGVKVVDQNTGQAVEDATVVLDGKILAADGQGLFPSQKAAGNWV